ncbi:MAG: DUF4837 family protein [bacterium]
MKRTRRMLLAIALLMIAGGCGLFKPLSGEGDALVGVIVDGAQREVTEQLLVPALERTVETPQAESRFYTKLGGLDFLKGVRRWQSIIVVGTLEGKDSVSAWLRGSLSSDAIEKVQSGRNKVFRRRDLWATGQTAVFVVTPDVNSLRLYLEENADVVYTILARDRDERMEQQLYSQLEQKALADSLREAHGWSIRIPNDFHLVASHKDPDYVLLRRWLPDRFLLVAWIFGTPEDVTVDTLLALRNRIGKSYADSVRVNPAILRSRMVNLGGLEALRVEGVWETYGSIGGGPFEAYLLHDNGTLYLLDGSVFAPDRQKEPLLRQLDIIMNTFVP